MQSVNLHGVRMISQFLLATMTPPPPPRWNAAESPGI